MSLLRQPPLVYTTLSEIKRLENQTLTYKPLHHKKLLQDIFLSMQELIIDKF